MEVSSVEIVVIEVVVMASVVSELGVVVLRGTSVVLFVMELVVRGSSVVSESSLVATGLLSVVEGVHPAISG